MRDLRQWVNGGYFVLRPEIFDYLREGEDLVEDAFMRLIPQRRLLAYPYKGYWSPADTVKERAHLEDMYHKGTCPWMIWDTERSGISMHNSDSLFDPMGQPVSVPLPG
jgi:glucose-1-phosphate cytidylyltransferase